MTLTGIETWLRIDLDEISAILAKVVPQVDTLGAALLAAGASSSRARAARGGSCAWPPCA